MNVTRGRVVQDMLYMIATALIAGVLFSMAVAGVIFLLSGPTRAERTEEGIASAPAASWITSRALAGERTRTSNG